MELKGMYTDFDAEMESLPAYDGQETGFAENFAAAKSITMNEDMSYSGVFNRLMYDDRDAKLWNLVNDGSIPESVVESSGRDMGVLSEYARSKGFSEIMLDDELLKERQELINKDRLEAQRVMGKSSTLGTIGAGLGAMGTLMTDPIYIPTYFVGIGSIARGSQLLAGMARVAAMEAGIETAKQFITYNHKNDMGIDYTVKDSLKEIAFNAGIAAGLEGTLGAFALGIKSFRSKYRINTPEGDVIDKKFRYMEEELKQEPEANIREHQEALEAVRTEIDNKGIVRQGERPPDPVDMAEADFVETQTAWDEGMKAVPEKDAKAILEDVEPKAVYLNKINEALEKCQ